MEFSIQFATTIFHFFSQSQTEIYLKFWKPKKKNNNNNKTKVFVFFRCEYSYTFDTWSDVRNEI